MSNASQRAAGRRDLHDEDLYRLIAHELPHGAVFVVDRQLRYVLADGAGLKMTGYTPADFEGKTVREVVPPDLADQHERDYQTVLGGGTFSREHEIRQRHYRSHGMPLMNGSGEPELALVVSYDISERIRDERRLGLLIQLGAITQGATDRAAIFSDVAALLASHFGTVSCFMAELAWRSSELIEVSALLPQYGISGAQAFAWLHVDCIASLCLGRSVVMPPLDTHRLGCTLLQALGMRSFLLIPHLRDGSLVGIFAVGRRFMQAWRPDDVALVQTVAARTWNAVERCRMLDRLQQSDRHKDQVIALLGHELRSPISALATGIALLKRSSVDENARYAVSMLERQLNQIHRTVDDLLGLSYAAFGKIELRLEDVALQAVVDTVIETLLPAARRKHQRLCARAPGHPVHARADSAKLIQVLTNLVSNAVKYTPDGGNITISIADIGDEVILRVEDDGIGMDGDVLAHLFEPFVRGNRHDQAGAPAEPGVGIGLWFVRQIVEAHHGRITATSPGARQGSVFQVSLPASGAVAGP